MHRFNFQDMKSNENLPDFITSYFQFEGNQYKMTAVPEMLPSATGLDFTGNYIGILIISDNGTMTFERDQHPDKVWVCDKLPLDNAPADFAYNFSFKNFEYNGDQYKVVLTHELGTWEEDDGLEFTGCFEGILVSETTGTVAFQLMPDEKSGWECETGEQPFESGINQKIGEIASDIRLNQIA